MSRTSWATILRARRGIVVAIAVFILCQTGVTLAVAAVPVAPASLVLSFGRNDRGQSGTRIDHPFVATPIDMTNLAGKSIEEVVAGGFHSLLRADDGSVFAFGESLYGQTGLGITSGITRVATPIDTTNLGGRRIVQMAAGFNHSLLLADDGTVFSCGSNDSGQTGLGTTSGNTLIATPIDTSNLAGKRIKQVSAGNGYSLLLADDGTVFSFGFGGNGRTGLGTESEYTLVATPINSSNLSGELITQIEAGANHSLLLAHDGSVFAFGSTQDGRSGLGFAGNNVLVATPIIATNLGGKSIIDIAAGEVHSLLLAGDGSVYSFGFNQSGRTGLGTVAGQTLVATPINTSNIGGRRITQVAAGTFQSVLLADDGSVFSFGESGLIGLGPNAGATVATRLGGASLFGIVVRSISAGREHTLLLSVPEPDGTILLVLTCLPLMVGRRFR